MTRITKRAVEAVQPGTKDVFVWDSELRGFGLRVKPTGARSYIVQYRNEHGRSKRVTIGGHGPLAPEEARRRALRVLADVSKGLDPAGDRAEARKAPTVADLASRYLDEYLPERGKARSIGESRRLAERHILPAIGRRKVADVSRTDVSKLHHDLRATPTQANRVHSLLRRLLNLAEKWGMRPDGTNPCRHVERYGETKRDRYLSGEELARLGEALAASERDATERPAVVAAIRLLTLTGCRLSEILTLQWAHVDFAGRCLRLHDSKTGSRIVHLNAPALEVLSGIARDGSPWVIVGAKPGCHLVNLEKPWRRIRRKADMGDVRLHDLRHSFASVAVGLGEGLPMIGKLLGHTQTQTTARYAHLAADPLKAANERVGHALSGMMTGVTSAEVVQLKKAST
jgi:integrase